MLPCLNKVLLVVVLKSTTLQFSLLSRQYEIQTNRCACGSVLQVCHLQAILPLIEFLAVEVCRPLRRPNTVSTL